MLGGRFDLVISNPPYIVRAPKVVVKGGTAIAGTELMEEVVRDFDSLVEPSGALVLVYSEMARAALQRALPANTIKVDLDGPRGFTAVFDVEEVFDEPEWLAYLLDNGLVSRNQVEGSYSHVLRVTAVIRADVHHSADSIAGRVKELSLACGEGHE